VEMARLQGEGIISWWEGGTHEVAFVKQDHNWKISKLEHRVASRADYQPGRSNAKPTSVPAFSSIFPKDPVGPDRIV